MRRTTATMQRRAIVARLGHRCRCRCRHSPLPFGPPFLAGGCRARLFPIAHPYTRLSGSGRLESVSSGSCRGRRPAKPLIRSLTPDAANCRYSAPRDGRSGLRQRACRTKTASKRRGRVEHSLGSSREAIGGIKHAKTDSPTYQFSLFSLELLPREGTNSPAVPTRTTKRICYTVLSSCHHGVRENRKTRLKTKTH